MIFIPSEARDLLFGIGTSRQPHGSAGKVPRFARDEG